MDLSGAEALGRIKAEQLEDEVRGLCVVNGARSKIKELNLMRHVHDQTSLLTKPTRPSPRPQDLP